MYKAADHNSILYNGKPFFMSGKEVFVSKKDIRPWIDEAAKHKVKEEKRSKKPWAQVKINGILVHLVSSEINIEKLGIDSNSFRRKISKKYKKHINLKN